MSASPSCVPAGPLQRASCSIVDVFDVKTPDIRIQPIGAPLKRNIHSADFSVSG